MAIQISGTTVIDNSRNLKNIVSYAGPGVASQAEAEAGTNNNQLMTPLRVKQAIAAGGGSVINRIQRGTSTLTSPGGTVPWLSPGEFGADGGSSTTVPITSVNTSKTFTSSSVHGAPGGQAAWRNPTQSYGLGGLREGGGSVQLTSSTTLTVKGGQGFKGSSGSPSSNFPGLPSSNIISWEVIEFI